MRRRIGSPVGLSCARGKARAAGSDGTLPSTAGGLARVRSRLFRQLCCGNGGKENFGYVSPLRLAPYLLADPTLA